MKGMQPHHASTHTHTQTNKQTNTHTHTHTHDIKNTHVVCRTPKTLYGVFSQCGFFAISLIKPALPIFNFLFVFLLSYSYF